VELTELSHNLNFLMEEKGISASNLARAINLPLSSIKKIRNGSTPNPTIATIWPIANYFNVSIEEMIFKNLLVQKIKLQKTSINNLVSINLPVISWEEAVLWPDIQITKRHIVVTEIKFSQHAFALRIKEEVGRFLSGGLLLIEPEFIPSHQDYIIAYKIGVTTPTLKRVLIDGEKKFIQSLVVENNVEIYTDEIKILGVLVEYRQSIKHKPILKYKAQQNNNGFSSENVNGTEDELEIETY